MSNAFRDLMVWQQAMDLVEAIYRATGQWPKSEDYALKSQARRAAVSIVSNIAEGSGRGTVKDYCNFLRMARGSARELDALLEVALRVGYMDRSSVDALQPSLTSVSKLLNRLIQSLSSDPSVREDIEVYEP